MTPALRWKRPRPLLRLGSASTGAKNHGAMVPVNSVGEGMEVSLGSRAADGAAAGREGEAWTMDGGAMMRSCYAKVAHLVMQHETLTVICTFKLSYPYEQAVAEVNDTPM